MIFVVLSEAAEKGELLLVRDGLCRWHLRRDGVVVIRELLVLPEARKQGIGKLLVSTVRERNRGRRILAKCPKNYPSNAFWQRIGFALASEAAVNEWVLECD
jgi:GNAT superfamily N-acetyltransferase